MHLFSRTGALYRHYGSMSKLFRPAKRSELFLFTVQTRWDLKDERYRETVRCDGFDRERPKHRSAASQVPSLAQKITAILI